MNIWLVQTCQTGGTARRYTCTSQQPSMSISAAQNDALTEKVWRKAARLQHKVAVGLQYEEVQPIGRKQLRGLQQALA